MTLLWLLLACTQPCEFERRCDGNVLETCSIGPDQLVGSGISRTECGDTVNPYCVQPGDDYAFCAMEARPTCDLEGRVCDEDVVLSCHIDYLVAEDCALSGPTCVSHPDHGTPWCAVDPATACDRDTFLPTCAGEDALYVCSEGVVTELHCDLIDERATCQLRNGSAGCRTD